MTMTYDKFMRIPLLCWIILITTVHGMTLVHQMGDIDMLHLVMRLSMISFLLLQGIAVLIRTPPLAKASGLEPRISAFGGGFLIFGIVLFPCHELSASLAIISSCFLIIGSAAACVALGQLGRSFSLMAESRQLVTTGPYRWVCHPLYLAEEIAITGVFIQFASIWTAIIFIAQIAFQLRRMHNEEAVLSGTFREYTVYRQKTARLLPGVY